MLLLLHNDSIQPQDVWDKVQMILVRRDVTDLYQAPHNFQILTTRPSEFVTPIAPPLS